MRGALASVVIAACGGHAVPATPERATVQLVRCAIAPPLPATAGDDVYGLVMGTEVPAERSATLGPTMFSFGTPVITGALGGSTIVRALQARLSELQGCANKESPAPSSKAVVLWRFTIGATGKVIQVDAMSQVLARTLSTCVTNVIRGASFPAPPDGRVVQVSFPFVFDSTGAAPEAVAPKREAAVLPWTPFAIEHALQPESSAETARATEGALRLRLAAIDACFDGSSRTGSLRAMLGIGVAGELTSIRVGGLGDPAVEACVAKVIGGARVIAPRPDAAEIACDLSRGDAQPWRVSVASGYGVIDVSPARLRYGDRTLAAGSTPASLEETKTFALVADPDTTGSMIALALSWAYDGVAAIVALRAEPAPVFLGIGRIASSQPSSGDTVTLRPMLIVDGRSVAACIQRDAPRARLRDPAAIGALVQRIVATCKKRQCAATLTIELAKDAVAKDVVEVTGAARRAGFERVLLQGGDGRCSSPEDR